jgi:hypothetical protein
MSRATHREGRRPIAEISSGSVTIPIYAASVTVKRGKKLSPETSAGAKPDGDNGDRKTYSSFRIVYYEGTRRVFRRCNTLEKAKALAKELAGQLAAAGVRSRFFTEQDRRIYVLRNGPRNLDQGLRE